MNDRRVGAGLAIGLCFSCLICSIVQPYLYDSFIPSTIAAVVIIAGLFLSVISGLVTGILIVFRIFPKKEQITIYKRVLYGFILVLTPAFFLLVYIMIDYIYDYIDNFYFLY